MFLEAEKGIRAKLLADATLSALVGTRIYNELAAQTATLPYVVMLHNAGGNTNETPGEPVDLRYLIQGVSDSQLQAQQVGEAIYGALHEADLTLDSPWRAYRCQHLSVVKLVEQVERKQYYRSGGIYRIRAYKI